MSLVNDFEEFLVDSCQIKKKSTTNKYGEITFAAAVSYDCFSNQEIKEIKLNNGETYISNLQIYINGNIDVDIGDVIIYNGETMNIKLIRFTKEFNVAYSTIIYT